MASKNKKVNPRRKPASQADVKRAKGKAIDEAIIATKVLVFHALLDLEYIKTPEEVKTAWDKANYLAESVKKGYCSLQDMYNNLVEEYGVKD